MLERQGDPAQWHRDKSVIGASLINKDREEHGRGNPLPPKEENLGRAVDQALAWLWE